MQDTPRLWRLTPAARGGPGEALPWWWPRAFARLVVVVGAVTAAAAVFSWLRPPPGTRFVPLWVVDYRSPLIPPPPGAVQDRRAIVDSDLWPFRLGRAPASAGRVDIERDLDRVAGLGQNDRVVVYLGGVARCTPAGEVALLPSDAALDRPDGWVHLGEVLRALAACPCPGKLLILDVFSSPPLESTVTDPEDVSLRIDDELKKLRDPNLLVLCATSPGQESLASDLSGRSAFGMFLERGLRGEADGAGASGQTDLVVSAVELADYLADRVDRWAGRCRGARQSPRLIGPRSADFPLKVLSPRRPPLPAPPTPRAYPEWLLHAWEGRDAQWDRGAHREDPRLFRQAEAVLLRAERDWRGGADPEAVRRVVAYQLESLQARPEPAAQAGGADPVSLAGVRRTDAGATAALAAAFAALDKAAAGKPEELEKARNQALDAAVDALRALPAIAAASAAWDAALAAETGPDRLRFLGQLLERLEPTPGFAETFWLRRVAPFAGVPGGWPTELVRRSLRLADRAGAAADRPRSAPWVRDGLDAAAKARHEADVLLLSPGYVAPPRVDVALDRAEARLGTLTNEQDAVEEARDRLDDALVRLQDLRPALDRRPELRPSWFSAVREAVAVDRALGRSESDAGPVMPGRLREQARHLAALLEVAAAPFRPESVAPLAEAAGAPGPDHRLPAAIADLLASPVPRAATRATLFKALQDAENVLEAATPSDPNAPLPSGRIVDVLHVRRRASLALLNLAGLARKREDGTPAASAQDTDLLRSWAEASGNAGAGGLSWQAGRRAFLTPLALGPGAPDDPISAPLRAARQAEVAEVRSWLAGRFRYESLDLDRSPFLAIAAERLARGGIGGDDGPSVEFPSEVAALDLSQGGPASIELPYRVQGRAGDGDVAAVLVDPDGPWARVRISKDDDPGAFRLDAVAGTDPERFSAPQPVGVLVRARVADRTFHARVPIRLPGTLDAIEVRTSPGPGVTLRPNQPPAAVVFSVGNPSRSPVSVTVALEDADGRVLAPAIPVALAANEARPVPFAPVAAAADPKAPAPAPAGSTVAGPLRLVIRDPARPGNAPAVRTIPVTVLDPRDYVEVVSARYVPAGSPGRPKDRLEVGVRLSVPVAGADPNVELVVSPDDVPGFLEAEGGTFLVTPGRSGATATLVAEGLSFGGDPPDNGPRRGTLSVTVDGVARAFVFRTVFPPSGDPVTPLQVVRPGLTLGAPTAAVSGPFPVVVGGDRAPVGAVVDLRLDPDPDASRRAEPSLRLRLDGPRDRQVRLVPVKPDEAPPGALAFTAGVRDWSVSLPAGGVEGRRTLRAVLLGRGGTVLAEESRTVALERRPARDVAILGAPAEALKGSTLNLEAFATPPASGVRSVEFFVGRPTPDGKLPDPAKPFPAKSRGPDGPWAAPVALPGAAGPAEVSVRVLSRAGLSSFGTVAIKLLDTEPVVPGRVTGRVAEGSRPQPGLKVTLLTEAGAPAASTTSAAGGKFAIEKVPPGRYRVVSERPDSGTRAASDLIEIKPGETVGVTLELLL